MIRRIRWPRTDSPVEKNSLDKGAEIRPRFSAFFPFCERDSARRPVSGNGRSGRLFRFEDGFLPNLRTDNSAAPFFPGNRSFRRSRGRAGFSAAPGCIYFGSLHWPGNCTEFERCWFVNDALQIWKMNLKKLRRGKPGERMHREIVVPMVMNLQLFLKIV